MSTAFNIGTVIFRGPAGIGKTSLAGWLPGLTPLRGGEHVYLVGEGAGPDKLVVTLSPLRRADRVKVRASVTGKQDVLVVSAIGRCENLSSLANVLRASFQLPEPA